MRIGAGFATEVDHTFAGDSIYNSYHTEANCFAKGNAEGFHGFSRGVGGVVSGGDARDLRLSFRWSLPLDRQCWR